MTLAIALGAVALAYLLGSIPTAFVLVKGLKGIDIRTIGSGNVGATNAGRVGGPSYFLFVFVVDYLKGFLTTYALPIVASRMAGEPFPSLAVFAAVAAIVGHNFPIYLGFKGGKGVATSVGSVTALDPTSAGLAALTFAVLLALTRIVSISSLTGAVVFVVCHFAITKDSWGRDQITLSVAVLILLVLMFVRHRANIVRLAKGTEHRINIGRRKPPSGKASAWVVAGLALLGLGSLAYRQVARPAVLDCGRFRLVVADRVQTNLQRAERARFYDGGKRLAVTCPRYDTVVLYDASDRQNLRRIAEVKLAGRPMAVWPTADRLIVLQRPSGDARHLVPGFWQLLDFDGRIVGEPFEVGYDPDDLVATADDRVALVLLSGNAEGESNRPAPSMIAVDIADLSRPVIASSQVFERPGDDPEKIVLSDRETHAGVTLRGRHELAGFRLDDPLHPELTGRVKLPEKEMPYRTTSGGDSLTMPVASGREAVAIGPPGGDAPRVMVGALPDASALEVAQAQPIENRSLGTLPLRGAANLGTVIPLGLDYAEETGLIAVADRAGGVHLIRIDPTPDGQLPAEIRGPMAPPR